MAVLLLCRLFSLSDCTLISSLDPGIFTQMCTKPMHFSNYIGWFHKSGLIQSQCPGPMLEEVCSLCRDKYNCYGGWGGGWVRSAFDCIYFLFKDYVLDFYFYYMQIERKGGRERMTRSKRAACRIQTQAAAKVSASMGRTLYRVKMRLHNADHNHNLCCV